MRRLLLTPLAILILVGTFACAGAASADPSPLEDLAPYQPASRCAPKAKPGTVFLAHFIVKHFGGGMGRISEGCAKDRDVHSEHQEGRAFDWSVSATTKQGRALAKELRTWLFEDDALGHPDARARRIGLMYLIWNDHMYSAWNGFQPEPYLNSGCKSLKKCSPTLRHRNHVHLSLTRAGGKGLTSWFLARLG